MPVFIDNFEVDVAVSEDHSFDSEVTEHPVELGADVADHVRARPIQVTLEGIVSDTPIGTLAERRGDRLPDVTVSTRVATASSRGALLFKPSEDMFAWFQAIRDRREPVEIRTSLQTYDNMMLQSLQIPRSADTGEALRFTATFIQVIIVENQRTLVRVSVPRASDKTNRGNKPAAEVPAAPIETAAPWLLRDDPTLEQRESPRFVGANSGGRQLSGYGGSDPRISSSGKLLTGTGGG